MKKNIKTMAAAGMMVLTITASALPALANVNYYGKSSVNIGGSAICDMIIDRNDNITIDGENVSVVKDDEVNVVNSCIDTLMNSGITTIKVRGKNIDITNLDATNIYDSMIVTVLKQKAALIQTQERIKKARSW